MTTTRMGRRALLARYLELFRLGDAEGGFADRVQLVLSTPLQSPNFLYRTDIGDGSAAPGEPIALTDHEAARQPARPRPARALGERVARAVATRPGPQSASANSMSTCFVLQWFRFAHGVGDDAVLGCAVAQLQTRIHDAGAVIEDLLLASLEPGASTEFGFCMAF